MDGLPDPKRGLTDRDPPISAGSSHGVTYPSITLRVPRFHLYPNGSSLQHHLLSKQRVVGSLEAYVVQPPLGDEPRNDLRVLLAFAWIEFRFQLTHHGEELLVQNTRRFSQAADHFGDGVRLGGQDLVEDLFYRILAPKPIDANPPLLTNSDDPVARLCVCRRIPPLVEEYDVIGLRC